jgi:hypothetical protein
MSEPESDWQPVTWFEQPLDNPKGEGVENGTVYVRPEPNSSSPQSATD